MADHLVSTLLEACVVVGASMDKLRDAYQSVNSNGAPEHLLLEPEVLHVLAPPFVSRPQNESDVVSSHGRKRRSFLRKKREQTASAAATPSQGGGAERRQGSEDLSVPKDIDLMALPQLCFPDGLRITTEQRDEQFHFLVFTDVFGNKTHGVVMQCYQPILEGTSLFHNGAGSTKFSKLFTAYSFCVISKYPYFTALKDCLSCLLIQLRTCRLSDMEERVKEFAAKLSLVPIPPPGQLHLMFTLRPLTIVLPSREDKDLPAIDLDLHLPFLCFKPQQLLQVLSCLLQEQRVVLFSSDWARLTLVAESLLLILQPLSWQQPYVPVLARGMLDFLMAPTAFLMGCHLSHFKEVAAETDDLILINIDSGGVSTSCSDTVDLPHIPPAAADCFTQRCQSLQVHFDLNQCHRASCPDINEQRAQRRAWQRNLNQDIQRIALELLVNIFRDVSCHLNYEHRVFNSEEFLKTREPAEKLFYKKVLETHIFHSFLKDRLNKKSDNYARMELGTRSEMQRLKAMVEVPRRPTMQEIQARRKSSLTDSKLIKRLGMSLPNLGDDQTVAFHRNALLNGIFVSDTALRIPPKPVKVFKLPDFPASLSFHSVQSYYSELIQHLGKAISSVQNENSSLLARFYYLRGFINTLCLRRLDALSDFQKLYKTDTAIFPTQLVTWLVDSLHQDERKQADRRPELKRLILKVKTENEKPSVQPDDHVKKFKLPRKPLHQDEFVRCIQECGIVKDVATIHRLFDAFTDGQSKQLDPELFRLFYNFWKETEAEAQDVNLPAQVIDHLDNSECVYKLSSCVKTSHGVGKIAMTQKRLFLLTEGQPGYLEITKFRDIQEVKIASAPFLLVRIPSLRIQTTSRPEVFEANLKTETDLWNLLVIEMWAGRKMADQHKDPQYMTQALTNALLMDAVVGCLQTQRSIIAASKLAYFDKIKHEVPMMVPKATSETLKHKINPSKDLAEPQTVRVLLYTPGHLTCDLSEGKKNPKLWVALSGGKVVVFDAASWSMLEDCIQVGELQLNCMLGLVQEQVWIGSQDSVIYIIDTHSMSCNKQLTEHRHEVTGLTLDTKDSQQLFSCSCDGTILQWDSVSLKVKRQFHLSCDHLSSIQIHDGILWCCCNDSIVELKKSGTPQRRMSLPDDLRCIPGSFSSFIVIPEQGQLWTACAESGELCLWHITDHRCPYKRISLPGSSGVTCMIHVKDQIWVGCRGWPTVGGEYDGRIRSQVLVVNPESRTVEKELQAHSDSIQTLCTAEDRYVLSGSARRDGKIAIWKVE
ncbi:DENN domain-containing protein 3-like [Solea solea]|uniref:DENN domain-containing protein 3-like n=1 Tax=Solea solea TaxID=90069 RepID=UPI002729B770|nr:DENN domain-containing protein 3-like [Solea solea]XP_058502766.1 DENN domain-containing protein 3-like [Solea solea]XP_058502768.1 DENN domain-containing protein 3-like [Solea solea]XP_058502769.1 DENN domain-containing protein 3-like [Solea solea]